MDLTTALSPNPAVRPLGGLDQFDRAEAAPEYKPVPAGFYHAKVLKGEMIQTRAGADGYRMRFEILEGDFAGHTLARTWTFTPKALPYAKRDLAAFGLTTAAQLLAPFPPALQVVVCKLTVALQRGDDGLERNDIKRIDVLRITNHPAAEFAIGTSEGGTP